MDPKFGRYAICTAIMCDVQPLRKTQIQTVREFYSKQWLLIFGYPDWESKNDVRWPIHY